MKLNFKTLGEGKPLVIVHGLFGSLDNWHTLGKRFAEKYRVFLVDMRNHGRSPHTDEFSYNLMADDLKQLFVDEGIQDAVLMGHSMGGKVAMVFAKRYAEFLRGLIVADIGIKEYASHHDQILKGMKALDLDQITSRREADKMMKEYVPELGMRQFLLKNLDRKERKKLDWRINIPVLERSMPEILRALDEVEDIETKTLFIRGGKSDYIKDDDIALLSDRFSNIRIETMHDVGHWVHAEDPDVFFQITTGFIDAI